MKKLTLATAVFVLLLLLPLSALADNTKWRDNAYNFRALRALELLSITVVDQRDDTFTTDGIAARKLLDALKNDCQKKNLNVVFGSQNINFVPNFEANDIILEESVLQGEIPDTLSSNTLALKVIISRFGYRTRYIPAHQEERTIYEKERYRDNHGNWLERTRPRIVYDFIPAYNVYDAVLNFTWKVYDPATGRVVMTMNDSRMRENDSDTTDMMKRMTALFVQELTK
jgi:hypothetical protein